MNKGVLFTVDGLLALIFIAILIIIFSTNITHSKEIHIIDVNQKISDLLITSQYLEINNLNKLENNYKKLLKNTPGYIKINNNYKQINKSTKNNLTSQSITYINSSNKEIYIEIGVYY